MKATRFGGTIAITLLSAALTIAPGPATASAAEQHPDTFLQKAAHGAAAIERLGDDLDEVAALNDTTVRALTRLLLRDPTLWVHPTGRLFYIDPAPTDITPEAPEAAPFPYNQTFQLHSKPGSSRTIYLDFDGQTVSGTAWNGAPYLLAPLIHPAFSLDGDATTFSDTERDAIQSIWQRVSEDYAPFDVDVTTADPGTEALRRTTASDLVYGTRALITPSTAAAGTLCGNGCGGIAFIGTFDFPGADAGVGGSDYYQPAWVFPQLLGNDTKAIAEAVTHEVGHNLGLGHDGGPANPSYYEGQGSWAPIMGVAYGRPISQWSQGEYAGANNAQDDLAVITSHGLSYITDDHGNSIAAATAVTDPTRTASGLITTRGDVDYLGFPQGCAGDVTVTVTPAPNSPNLDARLRLFSSNGTLLASNDPLSGSAPFPDQFDLATGMGASATVPVTVGSVLYAEVDGVGAGDPVTDGYSDYASLGRYTIASTGCAPAGTAVVAFQSAAQSVGEGVGTAQLTVTRGGDTTIPASVGYARTDGTATAGSDFSIPASTVSFAAGETQKTIPVTIVDDTDDEADETIQVTLSSPGSGTTLGPITASTLTITDDDAPPVPATVAFEQANQSAGEGAGTVQLDVTRSGNTTVPASVDYTRSGGSATSGQDFSFAAGTISFAAGETQKSIPVTIVDDAEDEADETVAITLSSPGAGTVLGAVTTSTLTITDDDAPAPATVGFAADPAPVDEDAGTVELSVTRTGNTAVQSSVDYARSAGSTTLTDVLLDSGTLTFAPGQTERTIEVTVVDDSELEPSETFELTLSAPSVGTSVGTASTTLTILDSDQQPDLLISTRKKAGYAGDGVYNADGKQQSKTLSATRGQLRSFFVRVTNDGTTTNTFTLTGTKASKGSTVTYLNAGNDLTSFITGPDGATAELAPSEFALIQVTVKIGKKAVIGSSKAMKLTATWVGDSTAVDVVKGSVTVLRG